MLHACLFRRLDRSLVLCKPLAGRVERVGRDQGQAVDAAERLGQRRIVEVDLAKLRAFAGKVRYFRGVAGAGDNLAGFGFEQNFGGAPAELPLAPVTRRVDWPDMIFFPLCKIVLKSLSETTTACESEPRP